MQVKGFAAPSRGAALTPFTFARREAGPRDVVIDITHCGVCHSDIHQAKGEWGEAHFPMVPGHEIIGRVSAVGAQVKRFAVGDTAGVGCFVDSCRSCASCKAERQQFCSVHTAFTYNCTEMDLTTQTYGGYSKRIVVDDAYVLRVSPKLAPERAAPRRCCAPVSPPFPRCESLV